MNSSFIQSKIPTFEIFYRSQIDQASLGLSREYLIKKLEEPFVAAYHRYQIDLAVLFKATPANAELDMKAALDFEIELAEVRKFEVNID
jgi:hypothetical protein